MTNLNSAKQRKGNKMDQSNDVAKTKPDQNDDAKGPRVTVEHINSLQEVKFHEAWDNTIQHLWDHAYIELHEPRRPQDRLQTEDGKDLTPYLGITLKNLHDDIGIKTHKFQIIGPTGGATK